MKEIYSVTPQASRKFLQGVRSIYEAAVRYTKAKSPLNDDVIHVKVVNFEKWETSQISDIEYFIECYSNVLAFSGSEQNAVFDEFVEYVHLKEKDIHVLYHSQFGSQQRNPWKMIWMEKRHLFE